MLILEMKNKSDYFVELKEPGWLLELSFTVDIVRHLNTLNISLQGKGVFAHGLYWNVKAFQAKLQLFCTQVQQKVYLHFHTLNIIAVTEEANVKYAAILAGLCHEFTHFCDLKEN